MSRRQADALVDKGVVTVDGKPARLGQNIDEHLSVVKINGEPTSKPKPFSYVLLNKPTGFVCSQKQQDDKPTIYSLLPKHLGHLQVCGRLDADSSGLVMLTNDGDLALKLTHPKFKKQKKYEVTLNKTLANVDRDHIERGVKLEDGLSKLELSGSGQKWLATMAEGRNRQIRRTFNQLGYETVKLHRTQLGPYRLAELAPKEYYSIDKI